LQNRSFIIKILFFFILIVLAFLAFIFIFFFQNISDNVIAEQAKYLETYSHLMENGILEALEGGSPGNLQSFIDTHAEYIDSRITYIDRDGVVLADTEEDPAFMDNHSGRPEIKNALEGEVNYNIRFSNTLRKNMLYFAYPVRENNRITGVLRTSIFIEYVDLLITELKIQYLLIICFLVAASISAILIIYFNFKKEINRFSLISRKVSEGDFDISFSKTESSEIRELSKSFENMIIRIKTLIAELVSEKEEINSIISSIDEGIAVLDDKGNIVRVNRSFLSIFNTGTALGRPYWEIIRINEIMDLVKHSVTLEHRFIEVEFEKKILLCSISFLPARNERVLVFSDVTNLKNWETMKKELVTNVSHELGTPLTAIKGYLETLTEDETDGDKLKYLHIITRHTERLINIIKDLLTLSRLEEKKESDFDEQTDIREIFSNVIPLFQDRLEAKGLRLEYAIDPDLKSIKGDPFKLEQVFINLLDNAVKYTEKGEISITLSNEHDGITIMVKDTGIGIPGKDLDRIFERFYVVDKSRSRAGGGTGLGLSIVKHIILLHGGKISVDSKIGHGTAFTLFFPSSIN